MEHSFIENHLKWIKPIADIRWYNLYRGTSLIEPSQKNVKKRNGIGELKGLVFPLLVVSTKCSKHRPLGGPATSGTCQHRLLGQFHLASATAVENGWQRHTLLWFWTIYSSQYDNMWSNMYIYDHIWSCVYYIIWMWRCAYQFGGTRSPWFRGTSSPYFRAWSVIYSIR